MIRQPLSELNQSPSRIKNLAAANGSVILTNGGKPEFVLMTIEEFETLTGKKMDGKPKFCDPKFCDIVAMQDDGDIDFEPERSSFEFRDAGL